MALGIAENQTGVVVDRADVDEARGGGIPGSRVPPAVPVSPPVKGGHGEKAGAKGAVVTDVRLCCGKNWVICSRYFVVRFGCKA